MVVCNHITGVCSTAPGSVAKLSLPLCCRDRCHLGKRSKDTAASGGCSPLQIKICKCTLLNVSTQVKTQISFLIAACSEHFNHPNAESGICYRTFPETNLQVSYNIKQCTMHASSLPTPFTVQELDDLVAYAFEQVSP